jgi:Ca2+-binding EF-hand superfamily protein
MMRRRSMQCLISVAVLAAIAAQPANAQMQDRARAVPLTKEAFLERQATRFDAADTNGDGALNEQEYVAERLAEFDRADRNGDGVISRGELRGLQSATRPGASRDALAAQAAKSFQRFAAGGALTRADFLEQSAAAFDRADSNDDGQLTRGELRRLEVI